MPTDSQTFIRAVELWVPDAEHSLLDYGGGWYGDARRFASISRPLCFGRDEGLPGRAWESRQPIILKELEGNYFRRGKAAQAEGLTCAIAVPYFLQDKLSAVLVIFCGDDEQHVGAIELWHNAASESTDMKLADGYYGGTAEIFEFVSRHTSFRKGNGLPGIAWEARRPVFMPDLGRGTRFMRSDSAQKVGINRGFAIPCATPGKDSYVMAFLSALATPIMRRFETWLPDADRAQLQRSEGFCEQGGLLDRGIAGEAVAAGAGVVGQAFADGRPAIAEQNAADQPGGIGASAQAAGCSAVLALPVLDQDRVVAVVAWYF